jgi:hypothetical protein
MFFKKTLREEMEIALEETTRSRLEHADQMEYHRNMTTYFMEKEARLKRELSTAPPGLPESELFTFQRPTTN